MGKSLLVSCPGNFLSGLLSEKSVKRHWWQAGWRQRKKHRSLWLNEKLALFSTAGFPLSPGVNYSWHVSKRASLHVLRHVNALISILHMENTNIYYATQRWERERGWGGRRGRFLSPWGKNCDCFVQYCIFTIQNSIWHTASVYIRQLLLKLCCIKNKEIQ